MSLLKGVRVVEMGFWVAGPSAGGILADWGADVLKLELPSGDPLRSIYGALSGSSESRCPPFDLHNRGKRSVAIDVNQPEGRALAMQLIADADIFITNMRPQYLQRAGLHHEQLLAAYPKLVYGILTGYGLDGPDKDAPGYDVAGFSSRGGVAGRATPPGGIPPVIPGGLGDNVTALALVAGLLGALWSRERSGLGQLVSTSLLRTGIFCVSMEMSARLALGRVQAAPSHERPPNPLMNSYCASDGKWIWLIGVEAARHWVPIATALGVPHVLDDERFATTRDRHRNAAALVEIFERAFATHTRDEWAEIFRVHDVWWAPVNTFEDLLTDAQVQAAGAFVSMPTMAGDGSTQMSIATPVDFGSQSVAPLKAPPTIGAHTDTVLSELGVAETELERLRAAGIIA